MTNEQLFADFPDFDRATWEQLVRKELKGKDPNCIDVELQREFCNTINSEVTRLARFIDDLLSISSMEVGALSIDRQKVETERMFAEAD